MKRNGVRTVSLLLVFLMIVGALTSCGTRTTIMSAAEETVSSETDDNVLGKSVPENNENEKKEANSPDESDPGNCQENSDDKKLLEIAESDNAELAEKQKAEEESKRKSEEDARKKAEAEEEARIKAEEEQKQKNSFSMMYYLAITAEEICTSKNNRLMLDDIYTSLLNDINPGSIDEITQDHLKNLRDIIKEYISVSTKRERLQYIYNQKKASAIRSAVPNPIAILSSTRENLNFKQLAVNAVYTAVSSYSSYKNTSESIDLEYLKSGWELDDAELATIQKNRDRAFDYMVDMVQEYDLEGLKTLNEESIQQFAEICDIESPAEKIARLNAEKSTYSLLGNYWLELADCYFETSQYKECLECVEEYKKLSTGIYRKDTNYAQILPKAIAAAQTVYSGNSYITVIEGYNSDLIDNTSTDDWSLRYFSAQVYLDLYSKTKNKEYLKNAYDIAFNNVTVLLGGQRDLNSEYLNDIVEVVAEEPDYKFMSETEQKEAKEEYKAEQKRVKEYNKTLKNQRKTELPTLYEPLVINCEMLFALADEVGISDKEKENIEAILKTESNGIFLPDPINYKYSFSDTDEIYSAEMTKREIIIPVSLLTSGSTIIINIDDGNNTYEYTDAVVSEVERNGDTIDTFYAHVKSDSMRKHEWNTNSVVTVKIIYNDAYDKDITLKFRVSEFKGRWLIGDKVVFTQE